MAIEISDGINALEVMKRSAPKFAIPENVDNLLKEEHGVSFDEFYQRWLDLHINILNILADLDNTEDLSKVSFIVVQNKATVKKLIEKSENNSIIYNILNSPVNIVDKFVKDKVNKKFS